MIYPLVAGQKAIYNIAAKGAGSGDYNIALAVKIHTAFDGPAVRTVCSRLLQKYGILRSRVVTADEEPMIEVLDTSEAPVSIFDVAQGRLAEAVQGFVKSAYDLRSWAGLQVGIFTEGGTDFVLCLKLHHIVSDWTSLHVLMGDFLAEFADARADLSKKVEASPLEQGECYRREVDYLQSEDGQRDIEYWKSHLADDPDPLQLDFLRRNYFPPSSLSGYCVLRLSSGLTESLRGISARLKISLSVLFLAFYATLLSRLEGRQRFRIGAPIDLRTFPQRRSVGYFVNMLNVLVECAQTLPFSEVCGSVQRVLAKAVQHRRSPYGEVVRAMRSINSTQSFPSVDVVFNFLEATQVYPSLARFCEATGIEADFFEVRQQEGQFDLALDVMVFSDAIDLIVRFVPGDLDGGAVTRFLERFRVLGEAVVKNPELRISEIDLLLEEEKAAIFNRYNNTGYSFEGAPRLEELAHASGAYRVSALAVVGCDGGLSYGELFKRAERLAGKLSHEYGCAPGSQVAVMLPRSTDFVVCMLGVLKAGCSYVPIDPDSAPQRNQKILRQCRPDLTIAEREFEWALHETGRMVAVERILDSLDSGAQRFESAGAARDELAYTIFTSGSTGVPKGVMMNHEAVANTIRDINRRFEVGPDDRILCLSSFCFDLSVYDIFGALEAGAGVVIADEEQRLSPDDWRQLIREHGVTVWNTVPALMVLFVDYLESNRLSLPGSLRLVLLSGDWIPVSLPDRIRRLATRNVRVVSLGGATEAAIWSIWHEVGEVGQAWPSIPYGRPLSNQQMHVLDESLRSCPIGTPGEICIGGVGLARGYCNDPEKTDQHFVWDPRTNARLYRTGDLGCFDPSGEMRFLGRRDSQVKLRGYRIELGEVESALLRQEGVTQATVLARDVNGQKSLVAYLVSSANLDVTGLRTALRQMLPDYMSPSYFVRLQAMPLTANGKVDVGSLPSPADGPEPSGEYVAPRTEAERVLAEIWREVLRIERIGIDENYFELGGDSIQAIQVVSRARSRGYRVTVARLFEQATIRSLAEMIETAPQETEPTSMLGESDLSPIMHWFLQGDFGDRNHFNQAMMLQSERPLDEAALRGALKILWERHDSLRLRLRAGGQRLAYAAVEEGSFGLEVFDVGGGPEVERRIEALATELQRSFDLENGPWCGARLFRTSERDHLLLAIHHMGVDGVSWRILLEDLGLAYEALRDGREVDLPPKTNPFNVWTERLKDYVRSVEARELAYWKEVCGAPRMKMLAAPEGASGRLSERAAVSFRLDEETTRRLARESSRAYGTGIQDLLLTALEVALGRWMGEGAILLNLESHGREEAVAGADVTRTVGWFTNQYPFRMELNPSENLGRRICLLKERLRRVRDNGLVYGALRYGSTSLGALDRKILEVQPEASFNYLGNFDADVSRSGLKPSPYSCGRNASERGRIHYALDLNGMIIGSRLAMEIGYEQSRFEEASIKRLADYFEEGLKAVAEHCGSVRERVRTPSDYSAPWLELEELEQLRGVLGAKGSAIRSVHRMTPMQGGMYFHYLEDPGGGAYVVQMLLEVVGELDVARFAQVLNRVVERHGALRSRYIAGVSELPVQVIVDTLEDVFSYVDLSGRDRSAIQDEMNDWMARERREGFDLVHGSPIRFRLVKCAAGRHLLLVSNHHIVMDGWCLAVLTKEISELYRRMARGETVELKPEPAYGRYLEWLERQDEGVARNYWRERLAGLEEPTRLHFIRSERKGQFYDAKRYQVPMSTDLQRQLQTIPRHLRVTPNSLVQTLWSVLLARYGGSRDVVFGNVISGRPVEVPEVESMVGLFINTVPLHVRVSEDGSFRTLLEEVQDQFLRSQSYGYLSLAEIQRESGVSGALFDHILIFENYPVNESIEDASTSAQSGFEMRVVGSVEQTNYDFVVLAMPSNLGLTVTFEYDAGRVSEDSVRRVGEHFIRLAESVAQDPDVALRDLEILTEAERTQVVRMFNATDRRFPDQMCVHHLFELQAARSPNSVAVEFAGRTLTYRELNERANQLAWELRDDHEVGPEALVGLCLERSLEMVVGVLGILKAGGAYVPLDPAFPRARLEYMQSDSDLQLIVTSECLREKMGFGASNTPCLLLSLETPEKEDRRGNVAGSLPSSSSLAYLLYTSGSTGRPKGVQIEHRALVNFIDSMAREPGLTATDRLLSVTTLSFDIAALEIHLPLSVGATLVIASKETVLDGDLLARTLRDSEITVMQATPSGWRLLLDSGWESGKRLKMLCGGEALPMDLAERLVEQGGELWNMYGPTETTVWSSVWSVPASPRELSIGAPIQNTRFYVLDAMLRPLPLGAAGELYIAGAGLSRGYLNRPELTQEKFIEDPFVPGERMYRTGDLAKWRADGTVDYLGRIDQQVKIRGFRIELGEVENALIKEPGVARAVVTAREVNGFPSLAAYFQGEADVDISRLRVGLQHSLPDYMIPSYFVRVDTFPLTANGKVDRRALPPPNELVGAGRTFLPPRNDIERAVAEVWQEVLKVPQVSINDTYFELGGDSIKTIVVVGKLAKRGYRLALKEFQENASLERIGKVVTPIRAVRAGSGSRTESPLLPAQRRLLEDSLETPGSGQTSIVLCNLGNPLAREDLRQAVDVLMRRHEALRSLYVEDTSLLRAASVGQSLLGELGPVDGDLQDIVAHLFKEKARALDLHRGPVFAAVTFDWNHRQHLFLAAPGFLVDSGSWKIILADLNAATSRLDSGLPLDLGPQVTSVAEWARLLTGLSSDRAFDSEIEYWAGICRTAPALTASLREPQAIPPSECFETIRKEVALDPERLGSLRERHQIDLPDLLLTALSMCLSSVTDRSSILVELESDGRSGLEMEASLDVQGAVGPFANVYPFSLDLISEDLDLALRRVRDARNAVPNNGIGFGVLRYLSEPNSVLRERLRFDPEVQLRYSSGAISGGPAQRWALKSVPASRPVAVGSEMPRGLNWAISSERERLVVELTFDRRLFTLHFADPLLTEFVQSFARTVEYCTKSPELITPSESRLGGDLEFDDLINIESRNWN